MIYIYYPIGLAQKNFIMQNQREVSSNIEIKDHE
ncbi:hypothetical protein ERHA54_16820 [Erwinia rhapontici]|uniref:Uncharacterized protein n=1 Tax=Erwinia rhapontici TaxID=55212 RepID=A0ABN6DHN1_ERWRD|nr:hypothetical protein ERHA53_15920 [Erwinia rhapontici]BCQ39079.1 hypothetical protein ERHA54_16820 [Erwinia rhapontici]BCQ44230.1 hypothetical protein ERHA55_17570 [Erwinia rhapontici]